MSLQEWIDRVKPHATGLTLEAISHLEERLRVNVGLLHENVALKSRLREIENGDK